MIKWCRCGTAILIVDFCGPDGVSTQFWAFTGSEIVPVKRVTECPNCGDEIRERSLLSRPRIAAVA